MHSHYSHTFDGFYLDYFWFVFYIHNQYLEQATQYNVTGSIKTCIYLLLQLA